MKIHLRAMLMATAIGWSCFACAAELPATFDEARRLGDALEPSAATTAYQEQVLAPYFGHKYADVLKTCLSSLPSPDTRSFWFIAAIGSDGRVLRVYPQVHTNISECLTEALTGDTFPAPPVAPYFLQVEFQFAVEGRDLTARFDALDASKVGG
jgi:hypothetical protein